MARKAEWEKLEERFGEDSVFGEGSLNARLAVVGEAPGKQEVEEGRPFVGNAGKLLDKLPEVAGIDRPKVYVTNVVKVRPTRQSGERVTNRPPRAGEIQEGIEISRLSAEAQGRRQRRLRPDEGTGGRGPRCRMGARSRLP